MTTDKTAVALRVLAAINQKENPSERDVLLLRAYLPEHRDLDPDEMACFVIQETLEQKKKAKKAKEDRPDGQANNSSAPTLNAAP